MDISEIITTTQSTDTYQVDQINIKEIDMMHTSTITKHYRDQSEALASKTLILDLVKVSYLDSSGMGCLISLQIKDYGPGKLILANIKDTIWKIFLISGIADRVIKAENVDDAISMI